MQNELNAWDFLADILNLTNSIYLKNMLHTKVNIPMHIKCVIYTRKILSECKMAKIKGTYDLIFFKMLLKIPLL